MQMRLNRFLKIANYYNFSCVCKGNVKKYFVFKKWWMSINVDYSTIFCTNRNIHIYKIIELEYWEQLYALYLNYSYSQLKEVSRSLVPSRTKLK